ncbi:hypothetical protein CCACVL1_23465 [Corchorus capsularis]|uniref:Uncharacterized protein n=1 Tax=Corchorus capsularis TaxID=210143 RepID=A0A1R3GTZ8_COCAP|nr:hypothetical protein CCACVL1_23465 [Corchorus capsularis]
MDRTMDGEICSWIIEFLVRHSADEMLVKKLIQAVPRLSGNARLNKTLLLHSIKSEIVAGKVSEKILDHLEMIEAIDRSQRLTIPDSMKQAYCAVALECTAKYLAGSVDRKGKYLDAVKRIWRGRIENLEKSNASKLVSEELRSRRRQVEAALADKDAGNVLITTNTRNDAILTVKAYVREALRLMGLPFLEKQCNLILEREYGSGSGAVQE